MNKLNLLFVSLVVLTLFTLPVLAQDEHEHEYEENGFTMIIHLVETVALIVMVVVSILAAGMFAQDLGKAMKFIAAGLIIVAVNIFEEGLHHFNIDILGFLGESHSHLSHIIGMVGYLLLTYGFWKMYKVAKGVSAKKK